jgi:hypothetical protein
MSYLQIGSTPTCCCDSSDLLLPECEFPFYHPIRSMGASGCCDMCEETSDAWAVGIQFKNANTIIDTLTQHWSGQSWTVVPSPSPHNNVDILSAVADLSPTNAWAVGYGQGSSGFSRALIEHFNGASWRVVPAANDSQSVEDTLSALTAVSANDVWAVGSHFDTTIGGDDSFFEHWNGQNWSIVPSPSGVFHLDALVAISSTDIWTAVGSLTTFSSTTFEHWNGQSWSIVSGPGVNNANNGIARIAAVSSQDVWAVGTSKAPGRRTPTLPLIEHWNGSTWSIVPSPATGTFAAFLSGVTALSSTDAWAVGGTFTGSPVVEHWDGSQWSLVSVPVSTGAFNNQLSAVSSLPGGTVIAVGPTLAILTNNG